MSPHTSENSDSEENDFVDSIPPSPISSMVYTEADKSLIYIDRPTSEELSTIESKLLENLTLFPDLAKCYEESGGEVNALYWGKRDSEGKDRDFYVRVARAYISKEMLGAMTFTVTRENKDKKTYLINSILVEDDCRRRGAGSELLRLVIGHVASKESRGGSTVHLIGVTNEDSRLFLANNDFEVDLDKGVVLSSPYERGQDGPEGSHWICKDSQLRTDMFGGEIP